MAYRNLLLNSAGVVLAGTILSGCETYFEKRGASVNRVETITIVRVPGPDGTTLLKIPGATDIRCRGTDPVDVHFVLAGAKSGKFAEKGFVVIHDGGEIYTDIKRVNGTLVTAKDNCQHPNIYFKYDVIVDSNGKTVKVDPLLKNY